MRWLAFIVLFLSGSGPALAERVRILSGEHRGFSRLAFVFAQETDWELQEEGREARITFSRDEIRLDPSRVFELIPRARLRALRVTEAGALELSLGCDCILNAYKTRANILVLDIRGAPDSPRNTEPDTPVEIEVADLPEVANPPDPPVADPNKPVRNTLYPAARIFGRFAEIDVPQEFVPDPVEYPVPESAEVDPAAPTPAEEMKEKLARQLARAASQGLVETAVIEGENAVVPGGEAIEERLEDQPNARIETSVDRDFYDEATIALTEAGAPCLPEYLVNLPSWGSIDAPGQQIGAARRALYGEFDTLDPDAALLLIRTYLYFGFGLEARILIKDAAIGATQTRIYTAMAEIVDGMPVSDAHVLHNQIACDTPAAMWGLLAAPGAPLSENVNRNAVLLAFSDLPLHLRQHLGAPLAQVFLDAGDTETATQLRQSIHRAVKMSAETAPLEAAIEVARGDRDAADQTLSEVVSDHNEEEAIPALLVLFEQRWAEGGALDPEQAALAEAHAFEHRFTPTGRDLSRAALLSMVRNGGYRQAMDRLRALAPEQAAPLAPAVFTEIYRGASDQELLRHVLMSADLVRALPETPALDIADRLLNLGFYDAAEPLLAASVGQREPERLRLMARLQVARGAPEAALELLENDLSKEAVKIRAHALARRSEWDAAAQLYAQQGLEGESRFAAWQAEDWRTLDALQSGERQALAKILAEDATTPDLYEQPLASVEGQLRQSAALREALQALVPTEE